MKRLFVDSSYWIALELSDDQHHSRAQLHWNSLNFEATGFVTTTYVLDEAVTFLNARHAHKNAVGLGESILLSLKIELIHVDEPLFLDAWKMFKRYDDKKFSLTDCVSFVLMKNLGLTTALSFDEDFIQAGFAVEPG